MRSSLNAATPPAIVTTLLLNVPPWVSSPPRWGSNAAIRSARPPKAPNVIPPARYLPNVVRSGCTPDRSCTPPELIRDVITSSKINSAPDAIADVAEPGEESGLGGDAAGSPHHRFDDQRRDGLVDRGAHAVEVVVRQPHVVERRLQRFATVAEVQQSAVVRAIEHRDPVAPGAVAGELERHQVRLGARVGEAHLIDRREPLADELGEPDLVDVRGAEAPAALERGVDCRGDGAGIVPEQTRRVVAEEVDVLESVDVDEPRSLGVRDAERERAEVEHRARRAAREHPTRLLEQRFTVGPLGGIPRVGGRQLDF